MVVILWCFYLDDVVVPYTIMSYDIHLIKYGNGFTNGNVQDEVGKKKCVFICRRVRSLIIHYLMISGAEACEYQDANPEMANIPSKPIPELKIRGCNMVFSERTMRRSAIQMTIEGYGYLNRGQGEG